MKDGSNEHEQPGVASPFPMPWEDTSRSLVARFWGTLTNALAPVRGVPALCTGSVGPAVTFALVTALPLMLVWGIMPFTHTLLFRPPFQVAPTSAAQDMPVWFDVVKAMGIGFVISLAAQLSWALPFMSLLRAFADARLPQAVVSIVSKRFVLYRAWLVPFGWLAFQLVGWATPEGTAEPVLMLALVFFRFVPHVLVLLGAQATAATLGASALGALGVALVPAIMQEVVGLTIGHYATQLLPELPEAAK